jgi:peptidoglycan/xylan/chitin deacetylase (PgdA/CDA1 family)
MTWKHDFLAAGYFPLRFANRLLRSKGSHSGGRLRVLLYHDIPPQFEEAFASQLRWISRTWRFVTPREFELMIIGQAPILEDCVLLTFDDGFSSNRRVAEKILNPMGIKAIFFVVSNFIELMRSDDWKVFISKFIYPSYSPEEVPDHWTNMTWSDLAYLLDTEHTIGSHTANHRKLSDLFPNQLFEEIISSANKLENKLGVEVEHFAYTFGSLKSFSANALSVAGMRFKYVHTGMRGDNAISLVPCAIRRDAMTPLDYKFLLGSLLEGGADFMYSEDLKIYESWQ